jgi:hypothetical protein
MGTVHLPALLNRVFLVMCSIGIAHQAYAENVIVPFNDTFALNFGLGVFYTTIHSTGADNTNYSERQHLVYFGPAAGYSYTWVFPHDIFCNVNLTAGLNMGVHAASGTILFVPQILPKFSVGYHNKSWSANIIGGCTYTNILWPDSGFDSLLSAAMTLAFSRRF